MVVNISNFRKKKTQHLNWEIINGQLDGDNQVRRSPANSMQKKFKPIYEPCQDTERVSPCWHGCYFPGTGPEPLHSFSQQLFSWNSAEYFFPSFFFFFNSPTKKHVMLFNVTSQLSHHFNFFQGEAPHTETHEVTQ